MSLLLLNEKHEVPEWIEKAVTSLGGKRNDKPLFRVVWGGNHLAFGPDGITLIHPHQVDRWHLLKWHKGEYEHVYKFGQCPHMLTGETKWCKKCFLSGGEFVDITTNYYLIERVIRLFLMSENLQNTALQKNALMQREQEKKNEQAEMVRGVVSEAEPRTVPRSKVVNLKHGIHRSKVKPGLTQIH